MGFFVIKNVFLQIKKKPRTRLGLLFMYIIYLPKQTHIYMYNINIPQKTGLFLSYVIALYSILQYIIIIGCIKVNI